MAQASEPPYPLASLHEGFPGAKPAHAGGSASLGVSLVVAGKLAEPLYRGSECRGQLLATKYVAGHLGGTWRPANVRRKAQGSPRCRAALLLTMAPTDYRPMVPLYNYQAGSYYA